MCLFILTVLWLYFYWVKSFVQLEKYFRVTLSGMTFFFRLKKTTRKHIRKMIALGSRAVLVWKWKKYYHIYWYLTCPHQLERRAKVHSKMWFQSVARGIQQKDFDLPSVSSQGCCASRYFLHKNQKQSLFKTNMARLKNIRNICEFLCKPISRRQEVI